MDHLSQLSDEPDELLVIEHTEQPLSGVEMNELDYNHPQPDMDLGLGTLL